MSRPRPIPAVYVWLTLALMLGAIGLFFIFCLIFPMTGCAIALPFIWYSLAKDWR